MTWTQGPTPWRLSRRAALRTGFLVPGGWLLSGCDAIGLPGARPSATPTPDPVDRDAALLEHAVAAASAADALAAAVAVAHPSTAQALDPVRTMHAAHLAVMQPGPTPTPTPTPTPSPVPTARAGALRSVRESEQQYAAVLLAGIRDAISGDLARVLAAARAGVLMHLPSLEPSPEPAP